MLVCPSKGCAVSTILILVPFLVFSVQNNLLLLVQIFSNSIQGRRYIILFSVSIESPLSCLEIHIESSTSNLFGNGFPCSAIPQFVVSSCSLEYVVSFSFTIFQFLFMSRYFNKIINLNKHNSMHVH
uniref:Uncharacterized protein n=1 Tax=Cacopsylla melanoneura TaxID=428564 RepID=A0A8D8UIS1_9HEMI